MPWPTEFDNLGARNPAPTSPRNNPSLAAQVGEVRGAVDRLQSELGLTPSKALVPLGVVLMFGGSDAPAGYLLCQGQSTAGYPALAAIVGANVPDLRDRFVVGAGGAYASKAVGGADTVTLSSAQNAQHSHVEGSHSHSWSGSTGTDGFHTHTIPRADGTSADGLGGNARTINTSFTTLSTNGSGTHGHSVSGSVGATDLGSTGSSPTSATQAHENRPPYYALTYIIRAL